MQKNYYINLNMIPGYNNERFYQNACSNVSKRKMQDINLTYADIVVKEIIDQAISLCGIITKSNKVLAQSINEKIVKFQTKRKCKLKADDVSDALRKLEKENLVLRDYSRKFEGSLYSSCVCGDNSFVNSPLLKELHQNALKMTYEEFKNEYTRLALLNEEKFEAFFEYANKVSFKELTDVTYIKNDYTYFNFEKIKKINLIYSLFDLRNIEDLKNDYTKNKNNYRNINIYSYSNRFVYLNVELLSQILDMDINTYSISNIKSKSILRRLSRHLNIVSHEYIKDDKGNILNYRQKIKKMALKKALVTNKTAFSIIFKDLGGVFNEDITEKEMFDNAVDMIQKNYGVGKFESPYIAYEYCCNKIKDPISQDKLFDCFCDLVLEAEKEAREKEIQKINKKKKAAQNKQELIDEYYRNRGVDSWKN